MTFAIIGTGNRGVNAYGLKLNSYKGINISAICDPDGHKLSIAQNTFALPLENCFNSEREFFSAKRADALIIASTDKAHYCNLKQALNAGYKFILCEKPVTDKRSEMDELVKLTKAKNATVLVCHVLRYTPYYQTINKIIKSGQIGEIVDINWTENVAYWHFAHSFVRGNWRNTKVSAPLILAKCCHDLDLFYWYIGGAECEAAKSFGSLDFFAQKNAPKGSMAYCFDCPHLNSCAWSAKNLYLRPDSPLAGGWYHIVQKQGSISNQEIETALKNKSPYGRCVFKADNNLYDRQQVLMKFTNNASVSLTINPFSKDMFRRIHISGTKGELFGTDYNESLTLNTWADLQNSKQPLNKQEIIKIKKPSAGHLGGDAGIVDTFYKLLTGKSVDSDLLTTIDVTAHSHSIAYMLL